MNFQKMWYNSKYNSKYNRIFETGEQDRELVVAKNSTTTQHGATEGKTQTLQV